MGELHIGGAGLARGYLNRPQLTAEKFIVNPFWENTDSADGNPGQSDRLYKTGDLARCRPDGTIECLGRVDHQVKVRGYRIELGEIESTLSHHAKIAQAVATVREEANGQKHLVAYVVPGTDADATVTQDVTQQTEQWQQIWDEAYIQPDTEQEADFHIGGWNDSYTGADLDPDHVQEWVDFTVERILSLQPQRLLEIGCGTGLLLFRMAAHCQHYYATDLSGEAIRYLERQLQQGQLLEPSVVASVALQQAPAHTLGDIVTASFDTAISNSVIQFFPSIEYLVEVIETAVDRIHPSGQIFLGDILSLPLLELFHTSVQLYQAPDTLSVKDLQRRIGDRLNREQRLLIAPEFFIALKHHLPRITQVEIHLKRGHYQNELTRFRYDVVLHVDKEAHTPATPMVMDWQQEDGESQIDVIRQQVIARSPDLLVVNQVPNARIGSDVMAMSLLADGNDGDSGPATAGELRQAVATCCANVKAVEPEAWWTLQGQMPYDIHITWANNGDRSSYDVIFIKQGTNIIPDRESWVEPTQEKLQPWSTYANHPYSGQKTNQLIPQLRQFLKETLPDYMVPATFVILDELPVSPSGKVDRQRLPEPDHARPVMDVEMVAPRTPTETLLVDMWMDVLGLNEIGVLDNFFMLGGDSIQATQLISRVRDVFQQELSLHRLFESPTIAQLSQELLAKTSTQSSSTLAPIQPIPRQGEFPLSFAEQRLWFLNQLQDQSIAYNEQEGLRLSGMLDVDALHRALQDIVRRHDNLRTHFRSVDGTPNRMIAPERVLPLPLVNLQAIAPEHQMAEVQRLGQDAVNEPFDLAQDALLRVKLLQLAADDYVLLITMHHIITDGWSTGVLAHELEVTYSAFVQGQPSPLAELPIQYGDFAAWQRQPSTTQSLAPQLDYWQKQLADAPPLLELPTDHPRPTVQSNRGDRVFFHIDLTLTEQLRHLSQQQGATLFMTLFTAFSTVLYRYSGQTDILVGTPIANRNRSEIEGLIGFFVNTLVLRSRFDAPLDEPLTFTQLLAQVRQTSLDAHAHQDLPFEQLVEALQPERSLSHSPIFQVMFALQNAPMDPLNLPGITFEWLQMESGRAKFDLFLSLEERDNGLIGYWEYNQDLFEATTIHRAVGHFETLLGAIATNPNQSVTELPLLTAAERHQLLVEWNDTQTEYPQDQCIHQLFESQVEQCPNAVAVVFENQQLSYRALNTQANQLAHTLQQHGVKVGDLVGIYVERSVEMVVGLLAILKAGAAYVPLDPTYPQHRLNYMIDDANPTVLLTQQSLHHRLDSLPIPSLCLDTLLPILPIDEITPLSVSSTANHRAYLMYTSGSTGQPKGVSICHRGVVRLVKNTNYLSFSPEDRFLQLAPISFDAATLELWGSLLNGAQLNIMPSGQSTLAEIAQMIHDHQITTVWLTAGLFHLMVQEQLEGLKPLKYLLAGGDVLSVSDVQIALDTLEECQLINGYGPTENTTFTCYFPITSVSELHPSVPIGKPIANTEVYILDTYLNPVPIGITGELCIGGDGVAMGYHKRPELTQAKFIAHPFSNNPDAQLYKTGDLVRYRADGNIEFLGRVDHQVKLRGFRIELGEVEAVLSQHPQVNQVVVIAREEQPEDKQLVAYLVVTADSPSNDELRQFLKTQLPDYMVPNTFMVLEALPLTANGKVDRRGLPAPEQHGLVGGDRSIPPRTILEFQLAQVWAEVLNVTHVGAQDNFFDLGGHSLLAVRLMAKVEQLLGVHLPLATLFTDPTVEAQARLLNAHDDARGAIPQSPLVPIQPQGTLPPLFCVHPIGGNVFCYAELARHLGRNQPLYGLQSPGLYGDSDPQSSIPTLASTYIQALQSRQPQGPYHLAGWSMGGVIAIEMAQQLQSMGETVALVALIDSYTPQAIATTEPWASATPGSELSAEEVNLANLQALVTDLGGLFGVELAIAPTELASLEPTAQLQQVFTLAQSMHLLPPEMELSYMEQLLQVFTANRTALAHYQPQPYSSQVILYCAADVEGDRGWDSILTKYDTIQIPGDHYGMVQTPHVKDLAQSLIAFLEERNS
ncbi:MAG: amino acid adenylation domain-containing protein [Leptolyngbyaceae cyanobacterium]